ncbi:MAG TPA: hypothetical protein VNL77_13160, partial [Roseiflexaceae bacterium]|nr:hypothetical protein [Roseiflexaceae bacterium]
MPEPSASTSFHAPVGKLHGAAPGAHTLAGPALHVLLHQLTQSLTVLSSAAELVLENRAAGPGAQPLRVWLQPNAR